VSETLVPADAPATVATFAFVKISVCDLPRALDFYQRALGLAVSKRLDFRSFAEVILRTAGVEAGPSIVLYHDKTTAEPPLAMGEGWGPLGFQVADVDKAYETALGLGATSVRPPYEVVGVRVAFLNDPEGHQIELLGPVL
jgi:lactoylglutathione lyase